MFSILVKIFRGVKTLFLFLIFSGRRRRPKKSLKKEEIAKKSLICFKFFNLSQLHLYLVPDSYSRPETRESFESAKKWLEYESFEYESRLDTPLVGTLELYMGDGSKV